MSGFMGQANLPANPFQPEHPPLSMSLNNPPFVPQFPCMDYMVGSIPLIAAATALEIQNKAQANPLRTFFYNLASRNVFQTQQFVDCVVLATDWITLELQKRTINHPDVAVQTVVPRVVEMIVCHQVRQFQGLQQLGFDQEMFATIQARCNDLDRLVAEIEAFKRTGQVSMPTNPGSMYQQAAPMQSGAMNSWMNNNVRQQQQGNFNTGGLFQGGSSFGGSTMQGSRFDRGQDDLPTRPLINVQDTRPTVEIKSRFDSSMAKPETNMISTVKTNTTLEFIDDTKLKFQPSIEQPYPLAYNPATHLLYRSVSERGNVIETLIERTPLGMDAERHKLPVAFGNADFHYNETQARQTQDRLNHAILSQPAEPVMAKENEQASEYKKAIVYKEWICETSLEMIIMDGEAKRLLVAEQNEEQPDVFRIRGQVVTPILNHGSVEDRSVITLLQDCVTYLELRDALIQSRGKMSLALYNKVNRKMTNVINRVITQNMCISGLTIDSFVDDIADLISILSQDYSEQFANIFLGNQRYNILAHVNMIDEDTEAFFVESLFGDGTKSPHPNLSFLASEVTVTYLNANSFDLGIELTKDSKVSSLLKQDVYPGLHQMAVEILNTKTLLTKVISRHFIKTNDEVMFEITQGYLSNDAVLIKIVNLSE